MSNPFTPTVCAGNPDGVLIDWVSAFPNCEETKWNLVGEFVGGGKKRRG